MAVEHVLLLIVYKEDIPTLAIFILWYITAGVMFSVCQGLFVFHTLVQLSVCISDVLHFPGYLLTVQ